MTKRLNRWPWLTLQIVAANVGVVLALAVVWYLAFMRQSNVYSERLMSAFNIEPGQLHAMYVADVERQLWASVLIGLCAAIAASIGLAFLIVRPLRSLAKTTERLRHGDYHVRSHRDFGEVGYLAENVNALAAALEQEEGRRARYLADLSHELRTPITSLQGYIEGLEDGVFVADKQFYALLSGELKQLTALTHTIDAMQLSSVNDDITGPCQSVAVADFLGETETSWAPRLGERGLEFEFKLVGGLSRLHIGVSPNNLKQIADNLLSNMVRYASSETPCAITAAKLPRAQAIQLEFRNSAPELDQKSTVFMFDRFFRISESRTRENDDHPTGLGLSIVKQLCLSYGGNASAFLDGQELVITLILPLRKP